MWAQTHMPNENILDPWREDKHFQTLWRYWTPWKSKWAHTYSFPMLQLGLTQMTSPDSRNGWKFLQLHWINFHLSPARLPLACRCLIASRTLILSTCYESFTNDFGLTKNFYHFPPCSSDSSLNISMSETLYICRLYMYVLHLEIIDMHAWLRGA